MQTRHLWFSELLSQPHTLDWLPASPKVALCRLNELSCSHIRNLDRSGREYLSFTGSEPCRVHLLDEPTLLFYHSRRPNCIIHLDMVYLIPGLDIPIVILFVESLPQSPYALTR